MPLPRIQLPEDEDPHLKNRMEWWYLIGHLKPLNEPSHGGFTVGFIVLRARKIVQGAIGLVLFVDHETGVQPMRQATTLFGLAYRPYSSGGFRFDFASGFGSRRWSFDAQNSGYKLRMQEGPRLTIDLDVSPGPAYLLGNNGVVDYHQGVELAYYTRPHLPARGRLVAPGLGSVEVEGHMWLERQWGDADYTRSRWKYLLVHASDDEQWIFFRLDHLEGLRLQKSYACRMSNGTIAQLSEGEVKVFDEPDPANPSGMPVRSRILIPTRGIDLEIDPHFGLKQYYRPYFAPNFFEGASRVTGSIGGRRVDCWGMTEMANY